ncbi:hypothetical protein [Streptomyces marincola]|uniref:hypothetical protein n=1 Tax=Streptomyces marincola TaxID=2878388 RepID=UPI001CF5C5A4|nr:hypothetical protein [Streptomyces marincola]UCM87979.1 hypothetical protein LC193_08430 [Streptomyces marincola]
MIEPDEGPQTEEELVEALAPWPEEVERLRAALAEAGSGRERANVVAAGRMAWMTRTHPDVRAAVDASGEGPCPGAAPAESVWADYGDDFEARPAPGSSAGEGPAR